MANTISDVNSVMTLTNNGLKLYNKVQLGICGIEITRVSIGDGEMSPGEHAEDLVAPKHELINVLTDITSYETHADGQTCLKIAIGTSVEDYYMREINVWADDPDEGEILYAYCNFGDYADYVKTYGGGAVTKQEYDLYIATGRATEIKVDITSATQITRADLEEHTLDEENPHHVTAEQVGFANKSVLDLITSTIFSAWQGAADARHNHSNKSVIDTITSALVTSWNSAVAHISNKSNPHNVTKSQVGLGNVTNESKATMFTNPTFTGSPKAPTPNNSENSTRIATTAFVQKIVENALASTYNYTYAALYLNRNNYSTISGISDPAAKLTYAQFIAGGGSLDTDVYSDITKMASTSDLPKQSLAVVFVRSMAYKMGDESEVNNVQYLLYSDGTMYCRERIIWTIYGGEKDGPFGAWETTTSYSVFE